jgi:hypothetical protein
VESLEEACSAIFGLEAYTHDVPHHRRNRVPGGTYLFAITLLDRRSHAVMLERQARICATTGFRLSPE